MNRLLQARISMIKTCGPVTVLIAYLELTDES